MTIQDYQALFLDYFNNFLTVEGFADHHDFSYNKGAHVIRQGRKLHELYVESTKQEPKA